MAEVKIEETVEIRFMAPKRDAAVFVAYLKARHTTKDRLGSEMLAEWAAMRRHEARMVERFTRGNGDDSQTDFGTLGD
jgi:hypothetical protein